MGEQMKKYIYIIMGLVFLYCNKNEFAHRNLPIRITQKQFIVSHQNRLLL